MQAVRRATQRRSGAVLDVIFVVLAFVDGLLTLPDPTRAEVAVAILTPVLLFGRRRFPVLVFALTLPGLAMGVTLLAAVFALGTVAFVVRSRVVVTCCGAGMFAASTAWVSTDSSFESVVAITLAAAAYASAPVAIGQLIRAQRDLKQQLSELRQVRERDRTAQAELVLSTERARLAREMHDVVSHQVSLIAVQVGALMVSNDDPAVKAASRTIRSLAVRTLDELRQMVSVLRASGGEAEGIDPQPAIADLSALAAESELDIQLAVQVKSDVPNSVQRAVYRIVQEGLTNVRKHAPGSRVDVTVEEVDGSITVQVVNSAPTQALPAFPSSRHGLVGLAERAELLGGHVSAAATVHGGFTLRVVLPID
ncbi:sensor histidine kinase [Rhodococcus sp. IEGM1428]|uniref:sensor histidine kinase n=1 Tax=Rhodococcus sp. IEGM1428 TaxID=3392191 RepID=UPI003D0D52DD